MTTIVSPVKQDPELGKTLWRARTRWLKGFQSEATIRDFRVPMDEPPDLAGTNTAPNMVEVRQTARNGLGQLYERAMADNHRICLCLPCVPDTTLFHFETQVHIRSEWRVNFVRTPRAILPIPLRAKLLSPPRTHSSRIYTDRATPARRNGGDVMLKRILWLAMLTLVAIAFPRLVSAESSPRIANLSIAVWPEHDQPGVLVQYQGQLADGAQTPLPLDVTFLVPKGAGIGAVCAIQKDGTHTSETWKEGDAGDGFTGVTYKLTQPQFHVEFYYNPLVGNTDKTMQFAYKAVLPVDQLTLEIQHPLQATNFVLTPSENESHKDNKGFTYHTVNAAQLAAEETVSAKISYTKTDPKPSITNEKTKATATAVDSTGGIDVQKTN